MTSSEPPRLSAFNPARVSFGRHETFPLRYAWLPKGFAEMKGNPRCFESDEAPVRLGVGKNMVHAIRYWLRAARMARVTADGMFATALGERLLSEDGWDPYLEDEGTLWLIHWLLAANPEEATAWWWFFNRFHKVEFSSAEAGEALLTFARENVTAKYSAAKARQDAALVLRMYARSGGGSGVGFEDALDSPLANLGLVSRLGGSRRYRSRAGRQEGLPTGIVAFVLAELFELTGAAELAVDALMYGGAGLPAPGAVFRLSEAALLAALEDCVERFPKDFRLQETAGLRQLFALRRVAPLECLRRHYERANRELAA